MAGAAIKGLGKAYNLYKCRADAMNRKSKQTGSKRAATESLPEEYSDDMEAKKKVIKTKKQ